jgi:hypothetical protein
MLASVVMLSEILMVRLKMLRPMWLLQLITPLHLHFHFVTEATPLHIDLDLALPAFVVILTFKSQIVCHGDFILNCTVKQRNRWSDLATSFRYNGSRGTEFNKTHLHA